MGTEIMGAKRAVFWLLVVAGPPILLLLLLEALLRVLVPADRPFAARLKASQQVDVAALSDSNMKGLVTPSVVPGLVYALKPKRLARFTGVDVRTNAHGFRGAEFDDRKPDGTKRIVGLGDSVMFGWGVPEEATYMARLGAAFAARPELGKIEVLNCAVPGYNSPQEGVLLRETCGAFEPDLLIVGYTLNDGDPPIFEDPPEPRGFLQNSRLFQLGHDLWRARFPPPTVEAERNRRIRLGLEDIADFARGRGIPVAFLIYPQHLKYYDPDVPKRIGTDLGFVYADLYECFERLYRERRLRSIEDVSLGPHDAHPNREGHEMMATCLEPVVATILERGQP